LTIIWRKREFLIWAKEFWVMEACTRRPLLYQRALIRTHVPIPAFRWTLFSKV